MDFARLGVLFEEDEGELLNLYSVFWQQESPPPPAPSLRGPASAAPWSKG